MKALPSGEDGRGLRNNLIRHTCGVPPSPQGKACMAMPKEIRLTLPYVEGEAVIIYRDCLRCRNRRR